MRPLWNNDIIGEQKGVVMEYKIDKDGTTVNAKVSGRIDTSTAPQLEEALLPELAGASEVVIDFKDLEYISSAGLRLLLMLQKKMNAADGTFKILNVNDFVMEVFEITGFADILTIE